MVSSAQNCNWGPTLLRAGGLSVRGERRVRSKRTVDRDVAGTRDRKRVKWERSYIEGPGDLETKQIIDTEIRSRQQWPTVGTPP